MAPKTGRKKIAKKNDLVLTFDADKRKEYLTGFRKRKQERKNKAREELDRQIKAEKLRINKDKREEITKKNELLEAFVDQFKAGEEDEEVIETEEQTVVIKKVKMSEEPDFDEIAESSRAQIIDAIKAKAVKKDDFADKKLKKKLAEQQSLKAKTGTARRGNRGGTKAAPKGAPKAAKKGKKKTDGVKGGKRVKGGKKGK